VNFWTYIGKTQKEFEDEYLETRLVNWQQHDKFPLRIYTYGREAVHEGVWDNVTRKCRGIVVNDLTWEIVARPFEKFFNLGSEEVPDCTLDAIETWMQPVVWEKVDGFLCTLYRWEGQNYIASKGSFTSPHAKWATHWVQSTAWSMWMTLGQTPVFEGINPNLRIVVDYGKRQELVLLAIIDNETGEEYPARKLNATAAGFNTRCAELHLINWQEAHSRSYDTERTNEEGYVLTWYKSGAPPFRLKVKFADYLRLHRMVTGVSPKRVLEVLQNGWTAELDEWINDSNPWFNKFVAKWKRVIENEYQSIESSAVRIFADAKEANRIKVGQRPYSNMGEERKEWALEFNRPENKEFSGVLFAMLDGKDYKQVIWKKVKNAAIMKSGKPLVDGHNV
jgi:RNA ligase